MTCNIPRPSAEADFNWQKQLFENIVLGGASVVNESNEWYAVAVNNAALQRIHAISEQGWKSRDPRQSCDADLIADAARNGVYQKPATPAQGYVVLSGTAGTTLPSPLNFTIGSTTFITAFNAGQPTKIGTDGKATVRVRAVVPGAAGNLTSTSATLTTTVSGVTAAAVVAGGSTSGGQDVESIAAFRRRYIARQSYQPRANFGWLQNKALEWPGVTRVIHRSGNCCDCGSDNVVTVGASGDCTDCGCNDASRNMDLYVMFDNSFASGIAPNSTLQEVQDWLFGSPQGFGLGQVEIGVCGRVVPVTGIPTNVHVDVPVCLTATQLNQITTQVTEFFSSLEPSTAVNTNALSATVGRIAGTYDVSVTMATVNAAHSYGGSFGTKTDTSKVAVTGCSLEPDCDYTLTLNSVEITRAGS